MARLLDPPSRGESGCGVPRLGRVSEAPDEPSLPVAFPLKGLRLLGVSLRTAPLTRRVDPGLDKAEARSVDTSFVIC
jgi:hypothetical protein